jgi:hypothetical protein
MAMSRGAATVDVTDEIFEQLARSGEVPPYLAVPGEVRPVEAWAPMTRPGDPRRGRRDGERPDHDRVHPGPGDEDTPASPARKQASGPTSATRPWRDLKAGEIVLVEDGMIKLRTAPAARPTVVGTTTVGFGAWV